MHTVREIEPTGLSSLIVGLLPAVIHDILVKSPLGSTTKAQSNIDATTLEKGRGFAQICAAGQVLRFALNSERIGAVAYRMHLWQLDALPSSLPGHTAEKGRPLVPCLLASMEFHSFVGQKTISMCFQTSSQLRREVPVAHIGQISLLCAPASLCSSISEHCLCLIDIQTSSQYIEVTALVLEQYESSDVLLRTLAVDARIPAAVGLSRKAAVLTHQSLDSAIAE